MSCGQRLGRALLFGVVAGPAMVLRAADDGLAEIQSALRARYSALDHLKVDFTWALYSAAVGKDPFDAADWRPNDINMACEMWIVRPDFRWRRTRDVPYDRDTTCTWIDGRMTMKSLGSDGTWSVTIDRGRWEIHGPMPVLTPFEMQVCDVQQSILELVEGGGCTVEERTPERVVLAGRPIRDDGQPSVWSVRLTLDPQRGWVPRELEARAPRPEAANHEIVWKVRVIATSPVDGVYAIREAVLALDNGASKDWNIYHFLASRVGRDDTLSKAELAVEVPQANCKLLDRTTGLVRFTDEKGAVVFEQVKSPEQVREDQQRLGETMALANESRSAMAWRQRAFRAVVGLSAGAVLVTAGVWMWRRRALRAA